MIKALITILKFLALGYLALGFQFLARLQSSASLLKKLFNLTGALIVFGLPISIVFTLSNPQNTSEPNTSPLPNIVHQTSAVQTTTAKVIAVLDGDSLEVQYKDSSTETIRLLGLDAPERGMCFGVESTEGARSLLQDQEILLEADTSLPDRDKFGRLARYVRLLNGRLVNQILIEKGLAFEYTYFTPHNYQNEFRQAEEQARRQLLGIWSDEACSSTVRRPDHIIQYIVWQMPSNLTPAIVTRGVDGDTIEVNVEGQSESIRFIGIDTPERGRCYADEATERQNSLTSGQTVFLEADSSQDDRDRYGRLLRYVWLSDGQMVNSVLVAEGYAYEYTFREPYRYVEEFMQLEHEAHLEQLGLWASTTCNGIAGRRFSSAYSSN